jgi:hypothetical protein
LLPLNLLKTAEFEKERHPNCSRSGADHNGVIREARVLVF